MTDADLAELIGSRICHDLISPVGAIGNGLELVMAEPVPAREDLALLETSARAARAALAFNRVAFGSRGTAETMMGHRTVTSLITDHLGQGKLTLVLGEGGPDLPRPVAKLILLAVLTAAGTAPFGGTLLLAPCSAAPLGVEVSVTGRRVALPEMARPLLETGAAVEPLQPREVHYLLLHRLAASLGARIAVAQTATPDADETSLRLHIGPA
jgi:histidine phosphotransferase ChpT